MHPHPSHKIPRPSRRARRIPHGVRNLTTVVGGEFCGTFLFLLLSFIGGQTAITTSVNDAGNPTPLGPIGLMYIASSFGTSLAVNVWVFYRVTGGMFNPAVTLGLVLVGAVTWKRALAIVPTQIVAGIAAAAMTKALIPGPLVITNALGSDVSVTRGLFLEMFLTAQLVLTVFFLAVEKHRATFLAPIGIGISVFIAHLCATKYTGTGINPARSFGPDVIVGFQGYHWIYWLGPFLGALLSTAVYKLFKWLEYRTANPGQEVAAEDEAKRAEEAAEAAERGEAGPGPVSQKPTVERRSQNPSRSPNGSRRYSGGAGRGHRPNSSGRQNRV